MGAGPDALTSAELHAALAEAWRVFDVPAPGNIGVCVGCCMDPKMAAEMLATPARNLTALHLREWFHSAYDLSMTQTHVAWVLPRLFEMFVDGWHSDYLGPPTLLHRLLLTGFPAEWSAAEVACVHRLCLALWDHKLAVADTCAHRHICDPDLDDWLCMMACGKLDLQPFLDRLWALPDADLVRVLQSDWQRWSAYGRVSFSPFWKDAPDHSRRQAWAFYTAPALATRLMACALAGNDRALDLAALVEAAAGSAPPH